MCIGKALGGAVGEKGGQTGGEDLILSVCFYLTFSYFYQALLLY